MEPFNKMLSADPEKLRKLEDRLLRAPGSFTTTGFTPMMGGGESSRSNSAYGQQDWGAPAQRTDVQVHLEISSSSNSVESGNEVPPSVLGNTPNSIGASPATGSTVVLTPAVHGVDESRPAPAVDDPKPDVAVPNPIPAQVVINTGPTSGTKVRFTPEEDARLLALYQEHGPKWNIILTEGGVLFSRRTAASIARRFAALTKKRTGVSGNEGVGTGDEDDDVSPNPAPPQVPTTTGSSSLSPGAAAAATASSSETGTRQVQLDRFFSSAKRARQASDSTSATTTTTIPAAAPINHPIPTIAPPSTMEKEKLTRDSEEIKKLKLDLETRTRELLQAQHMIRTQEDTVIDAKKQHSKLREAMIKTLDELDRLKYIEARRKCAEGAVSLGRSRHSSSSSDNWLNGTTMTDIQDKLNSISNQKAELDRAQKERLAARRKIGTGNVVEMSLDDRAAEEARTIRMNKLKAEEEQLSTQKTQLEAERLLYLGECHRIQCEDTSQIYGALNKSIGAIELLDQRYKLRCLLGKGGFSEVWLAFDLAESRDVAIKIHEVNPSWNPALKANYFTHTERECAIQASLSHPHIVRWYATVKMKESNFATVLEYCPGKDLDLMLKHHKTFPEKEARAIILQILSALLYLTAIPDQAGKNRSIIHFDLKPPNILFDANGSVKISDFGLSKIVEWDHVHSNGASIELTSPGAGTYAYLPPEVFLDGATKISNRVDVWSVGVIFYEMLYGRRPFGNGQAVQAMFKQGVMADVIFPPKPPVSNEAKDFIKRCLTHSSSLRPDVEMICEDKYVLEKGGGGGKGKKASSSSSSSSSSALPAM